MINIQAGSPVWHLVFKKGHVKKSNIHIIVVEFSGQIIRSYRPCELQQVIFSSEESMLDILGETIPLVSIPELYFNKHYNRPQDYFSLIDFLFSAEQYDFYSLAIDAIYMLIRHKSINDQESKNKMHKFIDLLVSQKKFKNAFSIAIYCNNIHMLERCSQDYLLNRGIEKGLNEIISYSISQLIRTDCHNDQVVDFISSLLVQLSRRNYELHIGKINFLKQTYAEHQEIISNQSLLEQFSNMLIGNGKNLYDHHNLLSPSYMQQKEQMKEFIIQNNITELLHFTNIKNVPSIIENGLCPRNMHKIFGITAYCSDEDRLDKRYGFTSLSVSFPNFKMLYGKRITNKSSFAILILDPSLLYREEQQMYFYQTNAASSEGKHSCGGNFDAFERMFNPSRKLLKKYPSDYQAEILIAGIIKRSYIKEIHVETTDDRNFLCTRIIDSSYIDKVIINTHYFNYNLGLSIWDLD